MFSDGEKPTKSIGTIYGAVLEADLILHIPNNKDITIAALRYLQNKIENYCCSEMFVTYCSEPALVLEIYDYRDRVKT